MCPQGGEGGAELDERAAGAGAGADQPAIGFVGLGRMGSLMAGHLLGWPGGLTVHDLRPEAAAALGERGATVVTSVEDLARAADLVCVMVVDDEQVVSLVEAALPHCRPGAVIAVHSTVHTGTVERLAARAAERGVALLDAPVSGGTMGAAAGRLALLVGGDAAALDRCREALGRFADLIVHFGSAGAGTRAKLARNLVNFVGIAAALEAARLAEAAGVDLGKLGRVTIHSDALTGGPGAVMVRDTTAPLDPGDPLRPIFAHTRSLGDKDLSMALSLGSELGVDLPLAEAAAGRLGEYLGVPDEEERG